MTAIFNEPVHLFVKGPAEARFRVPDFLAVFNTYFWPLAVWLNCCLFDTFHNSQLYQSIACVKKGTFNMLNVKFKTKIITKRM